MFMHADFRRCFFCRVQWWRISISHPTISKHWSHDASSTGNWVLRWHFLSDPRKPWYFYMLKIPLLYQIMVILILYLSFLPASFGFIVTNSSRFLVVFKHWMGCLYIHIFIIVLENADFGVLPPYLIYIYMYANFRHHRLHSTQVS